MIPDGNRRWAVGQGLQKDQGYAHGLEPGLQLLRQAKAAGVGELTYYGFTVDNCRRPPQQVEAFAAACVQAVGLLAADGADLLVLGDTSSPYFPRELLPYTRRTQVSGGGIRVNFLVNYGWQWDLSGLCGAPGLGPSPTPGELGGLREHLHSRDVARIDLVVRWGGMRRLSGLLPVQAAYADFFVVDRLWPDYQPQDFESALAWYQEQDVTMGG